jgi:hypothetical protein
LLALIEKLLGDTRGELETVDAALQKSTAQLDDLRQRELAVLGVLARARVQEIERGDLIEALDDTGKQVHALLAQRGEAQAAIGEEIANAQQELAQLGTQRTAQQVVVDAAAKTVDAAQADAQRKLAVDAPYRARLDAAKASDAMAALAEQKATAARTDRTQKGKPYEADALFMYLWARGYGTGRYAAPPFTRLLDGWVARVCDFEPLRKDYWMLSELPSRFDDHAKRMRATADADMATVRELETAAGAAAGVPARAAEHATEEESLGRIDQAISQKEAEVKTLTDRRAAFSSGQDDLSRKATQLLSDTFRKEQMRTLRERASRTPNPEDDVAVDELTVIRADLPRVADAAERYKKMNEQQRDRVTKLEELRNRFKEHRFDAVTSEFMNSALIATMMTQLLAGALAVPDFWDALTKQQRQRNLDADPMFGSGRFPRGRRGPRGPWGGWPGGGWGGGGAGWGGGSGGGSCGGTGGGFGGGGFSGGGGFGGGGFNTGGGF